MNTSVLRQNFTSYMQKRYSNNKHISSTVSDAFFLERQGSELGIDFQTVLSECVIPDSYKKGLEEYFAGRGRKNPRGDAAVYDRSLRQLLEHITSQSMPTTSQSTTTLQPPKTTRSSIHVPPPTKDEVNKYLNKWEDLSDYKAQEEALSLLFHTTYQCNVNINEVLIKCSCLNDFYGTNIFKIYPVASHITKLDIDERLKKGDPQLVNDIASGHGIKTRNGKELKLFSFATKYCSHHNSDDYPIFDFYVEKLLIYFRDKDEFSNFTKEGLRDYAVFKSVVLDFRKWYLLQDFSLKEIDQYLWLLGKEKFLKSY